MRVKIGTHELNINNDAFATKRCEDDEVAGCYVSGENAILINNHLPQSQQVEVVVHELMHAAYDYSVLRYLPQAAEYDEELIVASLTGWMTSLLTENPQLLEYLAGKSTLDDPRGMTDLVNKLTGGDTVRGY